MSNHGTGGADPEVSILIVSYNTHECLRECLQSLRDQSRSVRQEVLVLDNASVDESVEMVSAEFPEVELVVSEHNLGFARGVNRLAERARGRRLLLLNPDTIVLDSAVDRLVSFADEHPDHRIWGGRTERRDGDLEPSSCWAFSTLWSTFTWAAGLSSAARGSALLNPEAMPNWKRDTVREVDIVTGCLLLIDSELWGRLGGFDERYFMYGEDADLALRIHAMGYRPLICPDARVIHDIGGASATRADQMLLLFRGKATLMRLHWSPTLREVGLTMLVLGVALRAAAARFGVFASEAHGTAWRALWRDRREWRRGFPPPDQHAVPTRG